MLIVVVCCIYLCSSTDNWAYWVEGSERLSFEDNDKLVCMYDERLSYCVAERPEWRGDAAGGAVRHLFREALSARAVHAKNVRGQHGAAVQVLGGARQSIGKTDRRDEVYRRGRERDKETLLSLALTRGTLRSESYVSKPARVSYISYILYLISSGLRCGLLICGRGSCRLTRTTYIQQFVLVLRWGQGRNETLFPVSVSLRPK